jgi:formiminoglutamase
MTWTTRYESPSTQAWHGRPDAPSGSCFFQVVQPVDLSKGIPETSIHPTFGLIGFKCDEGIRRNLGRTGASQGPEAIREVLAKLPVQKSSIACYDLGNIICQDGDLEKAQAALGEVTHMLLQAGIIPIAIGGGHELAWGHYQGIAKHFPHGNLGIINFDAHFDMRPLLPNGDGSSGTPFLQIALAQQLAKRQFDYNCIGIQHTGNTRQLFETAKKHQAKIILADDLHQGFMDKCVNFVDRIIDENEKIYLSLCLDVFRTRCECATSSWCHPLASHAVGTPTGCFG